MVTSPHEWKILEWDAKPRTNKQIWSMPRRRERDFERNTSVVHFLHKNFLLHEKNRILSDHSPLYFYQYILNIVYYFYRYYIMILQVSNKWMDPSSIRSRIKGINFDVMSTMKELECCRLIIIKRHAPLYMYKLKHMRFRRLKYYMMHVFWPALTSCLKRNLSNPDYRDFFVSVCRQEALNFNHMEKWCTLYSWIKYHVTRFLEIFISKIFLPLLRIFLFYKILSILPIKKEAPCHF